MDVVTVDGREVHLADTPVTLMLNKPTGYLTTMSDPFDRPTVADLVPVSRYPGLFPIGRLDFDTTGILLFSTDGELACCTRAAMWISPTSPMWRGASLLNRLRRCATV